MNILITAAGAPAFYSIFSLIKEKYKNCNIFSCDINNENIGSKISDRFFIVPKGNEKNYPKKILQLIKENNINIIFPLSDPEVIAISKIKKDILELNCTPVVSSIDAINNVIDTGILYKNLLDSKDEELIKLCPDFKNVDSYYDFCKAIDFFSKKYNKFCVKLSNSHGGRGFSIVVKDYSARYLLDKGSTYTNLDIIKKQFSYYKDFPSVIVSEYMPQKEYSVDCFSSKNKKIIVPRIREKTRSGICVKGKVVNEKKLIDISKKILDYFNLEYNINIQYKYDKNNNPKILEINPRLSGTVVLCNSVGYNMPVIAIKNAIKEEIIEKELPLKGSTMYRVWKELYHNEF